MHSFGGVDRRVTVCVLLIRHARSGAGDAFVRRTVEDHGGIVVDLADGSLAVMIPSSQVTSAADAAHALRPLAGRYAQTVFGIGLLGASMLAAGVLPLATAYSISEALGFEKGVSRSFREAPIFVGIFTALLLIGSAVALIPGIPQIKLLLFTQCVNGLLLPVILVAIVTLANKSEIMGEHRNKLAFNVVAIAITVVVSTLSVLLIGKTIADMF
jgi:Mn2+/Fe2+ NRAMP family transporter